MDIQSLHDPQKLLRICCGFLALYAVHLCILVPLYNITFHPLAKYPGPKLYAAFDWPYFYRRLRGSIISKTKELHDIHGDTVRIRPDSLSFNTAQAFKDIYGFRQGKGQLPKDFFNSGRTSPEHDLLFQSDQDHSRMRKLLAHAFSEKAMYEQEPLIMGHIDHLIKRLGEQIDGPNTGHVDITRWYNCESFCVVRQQDFVNIHHDTTFDIIGDLAFGQSFSGLDNEDMHPWINSITQSIKSQALRQFFVNYPLIAKIVNLFKSTKNKARMRTLSYARDTVEKRLATETDRKDFIWYIKRYNDERGMSRAEIVSNSALLVVAGSETTATLLSGATYYLLKNRDVLRKLTMEIRSTFVEEKDITLVSVGRLEYLHAVLEESLRMYPPVAGGMLRRTRNESEIIDGHIVPGNTSVNVTQLAANRCASNFAEPLTFAPERWLDTSDSRFAADKRDAMQPFSIGPRNCIGRNLAYAEMRSILARVLWNFELELEDESQDWARQEIYIVWHKPPLKVRLSRRVDA